MALVDNAWYVSAAGRTAVTQWATGASKNVGDRVRQLAAPSIANERVFICVVAGTTHATTEPTWVVTRGATTTDNTVTWQECTGLAGLNGDLTNTPNWTTVKNTAVTKGQLIQRNNGASLQICTTAGTAGNSAEPSFSDTAGVTTSDNTVTWTSLGAPSNYGVLSGPHGRLANATTTNWGQTGNFIYVADNHSETQTGAISIPGSNIGTNANPIKVISFDHTVGSVPPTAMTAGATISVGASESSLTISSSGCYFEGLTFNGANTGTGGTINISVSSSVTYVKFKSCTINILSESMAIGLQGNLTVFENCTIAFNTSNAGFTIILRDGAVRFRNCTFPCVATQPTTVFTPTATLFGDTKFEGCDLSAFTGTLLGVNSASQVFVLKNCSINASLTLPAAQSAIGDDYFDMVGTDSGTKVYRNDRIRYAGTQSIETTIVRTGGATDGVTAVAWKAVTTANVKWVSPFELQPIRIWNDVVAGNVAVTLYGIWGGGAVPNNDDIWIDVEYLGSPSTTLTSMATSTKLSATAVNAANGSDASVWGGSTTPFKMTATIAPRAKGYITIYVRAALASSTFYVDPKPVLT